MIEPAANRENPLIAEVNLRIDITGLGIPHVVLTASGDPKSVASDATARRRCSCRGNAHALQQRGAIFEMTTGQIAFRLEAGVASNRRLRRAARQKRPGVVVERQ